MWLKHYGGGGVDVQKWELAYIDYQNGMKYKDIAAKHDVSINTVKSWKSRKWNAPPEKKGATKKEKVAHKKEAQPNLEIAIDDIVDLNDHYGISEQQRRFADYYIETANMYQSAIKADYSKNYAKARSYELLDNVGIKKYIDDRLKILSAGSIASQEEILRGLTRIFNRQENEHTVVTLRSKKEEWVPTGSEGTLKKKVIETEEPQVVAYPGKISDAVKAADLLLKRLDLSKDNHSNNQRVVITRSKRGEKNG